MNKPEIYYWEKMSSPHVAGLLEALVRRGCKVTYVVEATVTSDRLNQGWSAPAMEGVHLKLVSSEDDVERVVKEVSPKSVHICDGIRSNGMVTFARAALKRNGYRFWVFMETVDDQGWRGLIKRLEYRRLFWLWRNQLAGILSAGQSTPEWVVERGVQSEKVFPFAYFVSYPLFNNFESRTKEQPFRFVYAGQLVQRKRIDLLIDALVPLVSQLDFELVVVGSGPLDSELRTQADRCLQGQVIFLGKLALEDVPQAIANADCLILPSRHDGWGVVISEALMVGVPVICSDRCGAAIAVKASGYGGVFTSGDVNSLSEHLHKVISKGPIELGKRTELSEWARCLGADKGADYLINILQHKHGNPKPLPPWV